MGADPRRQRRRPGVARDPVAGADHVRLVPAAAQEVGQLAAGVGEQHLVDERHRRGRALDVEQHAADAGRGHIRTTGGRTSAATWAGLQQTGV